MSDRGSIAQPFSLEDREDPSLLDGHAAVVRRLSLVVAGGVN